MERHYLNSNVKWPFRIILIGCGGNGAQMLTGLANLNLALNKTSGRQLSVTTVDSDTVSDANIGRQPFYPCDIGRNKAYVLTDRVNMAYGLNWSAEDLRVNEDTQIGNCEMIISCVDTAQARRHIMKIIDRESIHSKPVYWLDLGNSSHTGQFVLGENKKSSVYETPRLKTVVEIFPDLAQESFVEEDVPSCSLADALTKQSLFINRTLASHALSTLYDLLYTGSITHAGMFLNIAEGIASPMPLPTEDSEPDEQNEQAK